GQAQARGALRLDLEPQLRRPPRAQGPHPSRFARDGGGGGNRRPLRRCARMAEGLSARVLISTDEDPILRAAAAVAGLFPAQLRIVRIPPSRPPIKTRNDEHRDAGLLWPLPPRPVV